MVRNLNVQYVRWGMFAFGWVGIASVLFLLAVFVYRISIFQCIDGCGPYHNTTSVVNLDSDVDLDAVVGEKARATVWFESVTSTGKAQASVWLNEGQAGLRDSGQRLRYTERHGLAVGDFNGDGYIDVFAAAYDTESHLWLNQGDGRLPEGN